MTHDYSVLTSDPDGYLNWVLGQLGAALSVRTETDLEAEWIRSLTSLIGQVPDPMIRAQLASSCSLRQLRVLIRDRHLAVRLSCVENPFAVDRDIQIILCQDSDVDVVTAFLDRIEPCAEAAEILCEHSSVSIRSYLASPRRARAILSRLAHDDERTVRDLATSAIEYQDLALKTGQHVDRFHRGPSPASS